MYFFSSCFFLAGQVLPRCEGTLPAAESAQARARAQDRGRVARVPPAQPLRG